MSRLTRTVTILIMSAGLTLSALAAPAAAQSSPAQKAEHPQHGFESMKALVGKALSEMFTASDLDRNGRLETWMRTRSIKGFRLGSCKVASHAAPVVGDPPRTDSAVSFCRS